MAGIAVDTRAAEQAQLYLSAMLPNATQVAAREFGGPWYTARVIVIRPDGHFQMEGAGRARDREDALAMARTDLRIKLAEHFAAQHDHRAPRQEALFA